MVLGVVMAGGALPAVAAEDQTRSHLAPGTWERGSDGWRHDRDRDSRRGWAGSGWGRRDDWGPHRGWGYHDRHYRGYHGYGWARPGPVFIPGQWAWTGWGWAWVPGHWR